MPFTVSHIAAVLPAYRPLSRARLFTAAVIGSMVPDFGLLLPDMPSRPETHSIAGLFVFCLPVGLVSYAMTLLLIKPALMEALPDGAYSRLVVADTAASRRVLPSLMMAVPVLLLAALIHLVWDGFTHENARGVRMFPVLDAYGPPFDGAPLRLYRWLQYASSIIGLIALLIAVYRWLRHAPAPAPRPRRRLVAAERTSWLALYAGAPLVVMIAAFIRTDSSQTPTSMGNVLEVTAIDTMRASVLALLALSLLLTARLAIQRRGRSP